MTNNPKINKPVPGVDAYYPLNEPEIGVPLREQKDLPLLLKPLTIRGTTFKNRIFVPPMCQYSAHDGHATDWHLVHLGGFASRGAEAICVEATAVVPEGRISPEDLGLWADSHIPQLKRIVNFSHSQGAKIGIQLAHAGRKASTIAPWVKAKAGQGSDYIARKEDNGWPDEVYGPSDVPYEKRYPIPKSLTIDQLAYIEDAFVASTKRSATIGFDFIELHSAHGYLLHSFLSPLSNFRNDEYGGSLENRLRFPLRVVKRIREEWPDKPLFVRISVTDWAEGPEKGTDGQWKQWGVEQSKIYVGEMVKLGVDLVDCSSGGNWNKQKIEPYPGYQVPLAEAIKRAYPQLLVGAVGLITEPQQAETILKEGKADVVSLARELLRSPEWSLNAGLALRTPLKAPNQYERAWPSKL